MSSPTSKGKTSGEIACLRFLLQCAVNYREKDLIYTNAHGSPGCLFLI